jgi:hypothetical protein
MGQKFDECVLRRAAHITGQRDGLVQRGGAQNLWSDAWVQIQIIAHAVAPYGRVVRSWRSIMMLWDPDGRTRRVAFHYIADADPGMSVKADQLSLGYQRVPIDICTKGRLIPLR